MLAAVVFAGRLTDPPSLQAALLMAAAFCLLASGGYALNDWRDAAADRAHPDKSRRPVAAGELPPAVALAVALPCLGAGLWLAWQVQMEAPPLDASGPGSLGPFAWAVAYLVLATAYTLLLRAVAGLDVLALGSAFVLRAYAGSAAVQLVPSHWLVLCGGCLALFLALGKRQLELQRLGAGAGATRPSLLAWSPRVLDILTGLAALAAGGTYLVYTLAPDTAANVGSRMLVLSVPPVAWLLARTRRRLRRGEAGDPVELLLRDGPTVLGFLAWCAIVLAVVYGRPW